MIGKRTFTQRQRDSALNQLSIKEEETPTKKLNGDKEGGEESEDEIGSIEEDD